MLYQISYWLFRLKLFQPSENTLNYWSDSYAVEKLEYAVKHGNYKTRQIAAEALGFVGRPSSIPILRNAIEDNIHYVSIAALNALERLDVNNELLKLIIRKRFNWVKEIRDKEKKQKMRKTKKHNIYRWERTSKKSFEMVKERLKRPIR